MPDKLLNIYSVFVRAAGIFMNARVIDCLVCELSKFLHMNLHVSGFCARKDEHTHKP